MKKQYVIISTVTIAVTTLALSGCGSSGPSNSDVRNALIKSGEKYDAQVYYRLRQLGEVKRSMRNEPPAEVIHMLDKHVKKINENDKILGCSKVTGATYRCSAIVAGGRQISFNLDKAGSQWVVTKLLGGQ
jgi:hypothetical protein